MRASAQIPVTFTAPSKTGKVSGDLYVDDFDSGSLSANEIGAVPYSYTVSSGGGCASTQVKSAKPDCVATSAP